MCIYLLPRPPPYIRQRRSNHDEALLILENNTEQFTHAHNGKQLNGSLSTSILSFLMAESSGTKSMPLFFLLLKLEWDTSNVALLDLDPLHEVGREPNDLVLEPLRCDDGNLAENFLVGVEVQSGFGVVAFNDLIWEDSSPSWYGNNPCLVCLIPQYNRWKGDLGDWVKPWRLVRRLEQNNS